VICLSILNDIHKGIYGELIGTTTDGVYLVRSRSSQKIHAYKIIKGKLYIRNPAHKQASEKLKIKEWLVVSNKPVL
jgi:hypothetical protein